MLQISLKSKKNLWCSSENRGLVASFCQDGSSYPSLERPGATCASSKVNCHEWELGINLQGQILQSLNKQNMKVIQTERAHYIQHISKEQCSLPEIEEKCHQDNRKELIKFFHVIFVWCQVSASLPIWDINNANSAKGCFAQNKPQELIEFIRFTYFLSSHLNKERGHHGVSFHTEVLGFGKVLHYLISPLKFH